MDADQRLTALKKAYADIILNTAKEAAARMMVSERRALRFQHELRVSKEESLRMLMRLKQMLDSQICEAEITSSSQQRKIEELEAQLQEAEDIVRDLREELREVEAKLERVSNNKVQHLDDMTAPEETSEDNRPYTSQSIMFPNPESWNESIPASDMRNLYLDQGYNCYNDIIHTGNSYLGNPDIPSIILRSKKTELYRNGCTQRIRACERNLSNGELSLSGQMSNLKHETRAREDGEGERICTKPAYGADNTCTTDKEGRVPADRRLNISMRPYRRRNYRAPGSMKNRLCPVGERISTKFTHEADNMCTTEKKGRVLADNKLISMSKRIDCRSYRAAGYKKNCYPPKQSTKADQASAITCLITLPNQVNNNAQSIEGPSDMTPTELSTQLGCEETGEVDRELVNACGAQNTIKKDDVLIHKLLPTRQEIESTEGSEVPVERMNLDKNIVPLVNSEESKASNKTRGLPKPVNDRIIKYTFQRKRKRESLSSSDGNASLEESTLKRNVEEKQTGSLELHKSNLNTDSSRDSRRLAQVARQLISLSEKKWWQ